MTGSGSSGSLSSLDSAEVDPVNQLILIVVISLSCEVVVGYELSGRAAPGSVRQRRACVRAYTHQQERADSIAIICAMQRLEKRGRGKRTLPIDSTPINSMSPKRSASPSSFTEVKKKVKQSPPSSPPPSPGLPSSSPLPRRASPRWWFWPQAQSHRECRPRSR